MAVVRPRSVRPLTDELDVKAIDGLLLDDEPPPGSNHLDLPQQPATTIRVSYELLIRVSVNGPCL